MMRKGGEMRRMDSVVRVELSRRLLLLPSWCVWRSASLRLHASTAMSRSLREMEACHLRRGRELRCVASLAYEEGGWRQVMAQGKRTWSSEAVSVDCPAPDAALPAG
eukprot:767789-Hanusia_phi.AAC.1